MAKEDIRTQKNIQKRKLENKTSSSTLTQDFLKVFVLAQIILYLVAQNPHLQN